MYLLDTNICVYIINNSSPKVVARLMRHAPYEIKVSAISVAELEYGAAKSDRREKNRLTLKKFLSPFEIVYFDDNAAEIYGVIRAELERRGNVIGPYDMQLAAQAISGDYTFVTNNTKEFSRIKGLELENWV